MGAQCNSIHTIFSSEGKDDIYACSGDSKPDNYLIFKSDTSQNKYAFILADGSDNIIRVQANGQFNFDGPTPALLRVWGISYTDSLIFGVGNDVTTIRSNTGCVSLSENVIRVFRNIPRGEDAFFVTGKKDTFFCFNNATRDTLEMQPIKNNTSKHVFVITKFDGTIIDFFFGNKYLADTLPRSVYLIYDVGYTGSLVLLKKSNLFKTDVSNGCFSIGQKAARLDMDSLDLGEIEFNTTGRIFAPLDKIDDIFKITLNNATTSNLAMVLYDKDNICRQVIIGTEINLNNNVPGEYTLAFLLYSGRLKLSLGDTIVIKNSAKEYSSDCFKWHTTTVNLLLIIPNAGILKVPTGDTVLFACPGDKLPDRYTFIASGFSAGNPYKVFVLNDKNKIIAITDLGGFIDFEAFGAGVVKVQGMSYTGDLIIPKDSLFTNVKSNDAYDKSVNSLLVNMAVAKGGSVSVGGGATTYYVCPQNDGIRKLAFERRNNSNSPYTYVLTSESGTIISFADNDSLSFSNISSSSMRVYGVAYSGKRVITKNSNLFVSAFSDGCYSVSDNFIRIIKSEPIAGGVRLPNGANKELFCPSDPTRKLLSIRNVANSTHPYSFVLTDSTNTILDIFPNFGYDFDSLPRGKYSVRGVSYVGTILIKKGSKLDLGKFSDDCFQYTATTIEVIIGEIDGGILTSSEGSTSVITCPSNLDPDPITMIPLNERSLGYRYVITNEQNIIIGFSFDATIDFGSNAINSTCRVYGVAFKGEFTGVLGRNIHETAFSKSCYDVSNNFVFVRKAVPPLHRLIHSGKDSVITVCVGDTPKDTIRLRASDTTGFKTVFLGVENGKIVRIFTENFIEFEKDTSGTISIYSVIYTGQLLAKTGLSFVSGLPISDDCFSISSNSLVIDKVKSGSFCLFVKTNEEKWINYFHIYPNPANRNGWINIEFKVDQEWINRLAKITIADLSGRILKKIENLKLSDHNQITVPITSISSGLYIINVSADSGMAKRKLLIQ